MPVNRRLLALRKWMTRNLQGELNFLLGPLDSEINRYLQIYKNEFRCSYRRSNKSELIDKIIASDVVLNGDYHTLKQSQRIPLRILREVVKRRRRIILATEVVMMKHQRHLDDFMENKISESDFLRKVDYGNSWGFEWEHFKPWFDFCIENHIKMIGLNTGRTGKNLRVRDRRAAELIAGITMLYPQHLIYAVFGDMHMAESFLPGELKKTISAQKIRRKVITVFENSETLYWRLAERGLEEVVDVVKLHTGSFCVMNVPPWVKLQSHINWIEKNEEAVSLYEGGGEEASADYVEQVFSYIKTIANYIGIETEGLDDFSVRAGNDLSFLSSTKFGSAKQRRAITDIIETRQSFFLPGDNIIYLADATVNKVAEEATKFIHYKRSSLKSFSQNMKTYFLQTIFSEALGFFGSKIVNHKRKCRQPRDYRQITKSSTGKRRSQEERDRVAISKLVLFFKEKEVRVEKGGSYNFVPPAEFKNPAVLYAVAESLGDMLGEKLYIALTRDIIDRKVVKSLFETSIHSSGLAAAAVESLIRKVKGIKPRDRGKIDHL